MNRFRRRSRFLPVFVAIMLFLPAAGALARQATPVPLPVAAARGFELPGDAVYPEGVVYDEANGRFYVSSTTNGTIFRGDVTSGEIEIFVPGAAGRAFTGLELDDAGRLYAAGATTGQVFVFDTATGAIIATYDNGLAPNTFLNDIAITGDGGVFVTDSFNPIIWRLPAGEPAATIATPAGGTPPALDLVAFVNLAGTAFELADGFNANGIVATPDGLTLLFVQANTGILFQVGVASGVVAPVDLSGASFTGGDGMILDGRTLYVVREGEISVVQLDDEFATGEVAATFSDPSFSSPTTIARYDGCLLVVNSQFANRESGQPELPFTLSGIPIPASVASATGATPTSVEAC